MLSKSRYKFDSFISFKLLASGVSSSVEATIIARLWALEIATFNLLGSNKKLNPRGEAMALLEAMEIITTGIYQLFQY